MNNNGDPIVLIFMMFLLVVGAISLMIHVLFYLTLSRCLTRVQPHNRDMEPGLVWLNLIPCFNLVWMFITVSRIASSLRKEYEDRGWRIGDESFGSTVGTVGLSLLLAGIIPYIGPFFSLAGIVCIIIYWVQIAGFSSRLLTKATSRRDDDDYYGRDRGRERRYDDDDYRERWNRDDRDRDYRGRGDRGRGDRGRDDRDRDDRDRDY